MTVTLPAPGFLARMSLPELDDLVEKLADMLSVGGMKPVHRANVVELMDLALDERATRTLRGER